MKALSIRQPWAWLIVNGHKDVENRSWPTSIRGPVLIHASKSMTRGEYEEARDLAEQLDIPLPAPEDLERGGIVGQATIINCVDDYPSPWFAGRFGFVFVDTKKLPFRAVRGQLGFFDVAAQQGGTYD